MATAGGGSAGGAAAGPAAATPAAQGAAQAVDAQIRTDNAPSGAQIADNVQGSAPPVGGQAAPAADQLIGQGTPSPTDAVTGDGSVSGAAPGWSASQNAVAAQLFKTFTSAGLSPAGASAIIGNWMQESSLNPSEQGGFLAQWGGSRLAELTSEYGPSPSAAQQAQFALQELRGGYPSLLDQLKTTTDPRGAALAVSNQYERPDAALANNANREAQAAAAFAAFHTAQGPPQTSVSPGADVVEGPPAVEAQAPQGAATDVAAAGTDVAGASTDVAGASTNVAGAGTNVAGAGTNVAVAGPDVAGSDAGAVGTPAPPSRTAAFAAVEPRQKSIGRNTVKFMAAVQPAPESPLYQQGDAATPASGGVVEQSTGQAGGVVEQSIGQGGGVVEQQPSGQAGGVVEQSTGQGADLTSGMTGGSGTSGGSISVSSSLLTNGQQQFAAKVAELTGLDPRVVSAWELAEESGSAAQGRQAAGNFDWLNIGYTDSANIGTGDSIWSNPITAAEATAGWIKGQNTIPGYGTASSGIQAILQSVGKSPQEQMMAIAGSGWASSGYDGGKNLIGTYDLLSDIQITTT